MRMSRLFSRTLRIDSKQFKTRHQFLLVKGGFIRSSPGGTIFYLPLAQRMLTRLQGQFRKEMDSIFGQEIRLPVRNGVPGNRQEGLELLINENSVPEMIMREINSHKQLPQVLYRFNTLCSAENNGSSLFRAREALVLQGCMMAADPERLSGTLERFFNTLGPVFEQNGIEILKIQGDPGKFGKSPAVNFFFPLSSGKDIAMLCSHCPYKASQAIAEFLKPVPEPSPPREMEKIPTPGAATIRQLCDFLQISPESTAKAMFLCAEIDKGLNQKENRFVLALVRGDMELNTTKLQNILKASRLVNASEEQILAVGARPGYGSPVGVKNALIVVDDVLPRMTNLVAGANETGYHYRNVNINRDFTADLVGDIAGPGNDPKCPRCGSPLISEPGVIIGSSLELADDGLKGPAGVFLDALGKERPVQLGFARINLTRLLACIAEIHNDENGLLWPVGIAPYLVVLVLIDSGNDNVNSTGDQIYKHLGAEGIDVLYDDRKERAGVKFKDADLIGIPMRITLSDKTLHNNCVEFKFRTDQNLIEVPIDQIVNFIKEKKLFLRD